MAYRVQPYSYPYLIVSKDLSFIMGSWIVSLHVFPRKLNFVGGHLGLFDFAKSHSNFFLVKFMLEFFLRACLLQNPLQLHLKNQNLSRTISESFFTHLIQFLRPLNVSGLLSFRYFSRKYELLIYV